jgi:hypothetical protein
MGTVTRKVEEAPLHQAGIDLNPHPGESIRSSYA